VNVAIEPSWQEVLQSEFDKEYFVKLAQFVRQEYSRGTCYPPGKEIFNAFNLCPFNKVKVVILGQDPYHCPGQAEGLCFSVKEGIPLPPSLVNIFKEVKDDVGAIPDVITDNQGKRMYNGSLRRWAQQGVLLLNTTLTVREHSPLSHQN
jgi:uracil-DNA glycosylase